MGQSESSQRVSQLKSKKLIKLNTPAYGEGELLDEEKIFIKTVNFQEKADLREGIHQLQIAQRTIHKNLVKVLNVEDIEEKSFCSNVFKAFYELEYFETDLETFLAPQFEKKNEFGEKEIYYFVSDMLNVLAFLENAGICHQSLSPKTVLLSNCLEIKIIHPVLAKRQSNFSNSINNQSSNLSYLCPIQTISVINMNYSPIYNFYKSDNFVLGTIILEIIENDYPLLFDNNGEFLRNEVDRRLVNYEKELPNLAKMLSHMLLGNENDRSSFSESLFILQNGEFPNRSEIARSVCVKRNKTMDNSKVMEMTRARPITKQPIKADDSEEKSTKPSLMPMMPHESNIYTQQNLERPKSSHRNSISKENQNFKNQENKKHVHFEKPNASSFLDQMEANHQSRLINYSTNVDKYLNTNNHVKKNLTNEAAFKEISNIKEIKESTYREFNSFSCEKEELKRSEAHFQLPSQQPNSGISGNDFRAPQESKAQQYLTKGNADFKLEDSQFTSKLNQLASISRPERPLETFQKEEDCKSFSIEAILAEERRKREEKTAEKPGLQIKQVKETYADGSVYTGTLLNNQREGKGILKYADGSYYDGNWKEGQMHGFGTLYYSSGKLAYKGEWLNDKFHGKGTVYNDISIPFDTPVNYRDFDVYEDMWTKYEGELRSDSKDGFGTWEFANGEKYVGEFKDDFVEGKGVFYFREGNSLKGRWEKNMLKFTENF